MFLKAMHFTFVSTKLYFVFFLNVHIWLTLGLWALEARCLVNGLMPHGLQNDPARIWFSAEEILASWILEICFGTF